MYQVIVFLPDFNFNERTYSEAAVIDTEFFCNFHLYQYLKLDTPLYYAHALIHVQVLLMTVGST